MATKATHKDALEDLEDFDAMVARWGAPRAYWRWSRRCGDNSASVLQHAWFQFHNDRTPRQFIWTDREIVWMSDDLANDIDQAMGRTK